MIVGRVEEDDAGHSVWVARSEECRLDTARGDAGKMNPLDLHEIEKSADIVEAVRRSEQTSEQQQRLAGAAPVQIVKGDPVDNRRIAPMGRGVHPTIRRHLTRGQGDQRGADEIQQPHVALRFLRSRVARRFGSTAR
jgi:hypothetical protein